MRSRSMDILGFLFEIDRYQSLFLASEIFFFRDLLLDNLLRGFFGSPIFRDFFDELFLKRGKESGAPQPKMCVFGLKNDLFGEKRQNHNFLLKKYGRYSILFDTVETPPLWAYDILDDRYSLS